jgi:sugar lactone lactonase YvrE
MLLTGEGNNQTLDEVIAKPIAYHRANGTLDETPVRFDLERHDQQPTPLRYPGKVLADTEGNRLFISDSNHNRIVVASLDGKLLEVIGSGAIGERDGGYAEASFDHPQGMALVANTLYVADTENHKIRTVDLAKKTVGTLAGTGKQSEFRATGGPLRTTALNSPWDLLHVNGILYVAMAGPHQIWSHRIGTDEIRVFAGSGREDIINGSHPEAALAQPSGLASDGKYLYVCDSEGSAIRQVAFSRTGSVKTLVGPSDLPLGRSLFEFGDINGKGGEVRLQHPLGVVHKDGTLFVADSYNHRIKQIDIATATATTFLGTGEPGTALGAQPQFSEPAGLSIAGDTLFIADTNNHRLLAADLKSKEVRELKIAGLEPPRTSTDEKAVDDGVKPTTVTAQRIAPGKEVEFRVTLAVPAGYKVNELYPVRYKIEAEGQPALVAAEHLGQPHKAELNEQAAGFRVPMTGTEGRGDVTVSLTYGYCRGGEGGLCKINTARWSVPLIVAKDAAAASIALTVPAASVK